MASSGEVFTGGATTSQHVEAENDDHFENTTFKLKRTRSMGLLDEFIQPTTPVDEPTASSAYTTSPTVVEKTKNLTLDTNPISTSPSMSAVATASTDTLVEPIHMKSPEIIPHDDADIKEEPTNHVDYLSHQWDVFDISKSWRYVIQKRRDVEDSARLENASWRTWAQRRSNLKTISPETLNWSKDNDVTWLYGPILKDDTKHYQEDEIDSHKRVTIATSAAAGDISLPSASKPKGPKPILKHRTIQQLIISQTNLLKLQIATQKLQQKKEMVELQRQRALQQQQQAQLQSKEIEYGHLRKSLENEPPEFDDYDAISAKLNSQYTNSRNNLNISLKNMVQSPKKNLSLALHENPITSDAETTDNENSDAMILDSPFSIGASDTGTSVATVASVTGTGIGKEATSNNIAEESTALGTTDSVSSEESKTVRRIHFNDEVQQCIVIEDYTDDDMDEDDGYYDDSDEYAYDDNGQGEDYIYEERMENRLPIDQEDDEDEDDEDDEEDGGFFLRVRSPSSATLNGGGILPGFTASNSSAPASTTANSDTASISTTNSRKTIQMLPPTTLNHGSSDEESDEDNPYTSSLSHYVNHEISRGYDYHYDYNTVYQVDPNHAIYGTNKSSQQAAVDSPDMIDVPDNITLGSNFDYEQINGETSMPIIDPVIINSINKSQPTVSESSTSSTSNTHASANSKFNMFDDVSDSDSDSDGGFSIETKTSSHSLAQLVFGGLTTGDSVASRFTPPVTAGYISQPKTGAESNSTISKQPTSSSSLSETFFGSGFTKLKGSQSALSDHFFDVKTTPVEEPIYHAVPVPQHTQQQSPSVPQRKASPLPPQTTSANAFMGNSTPPKQIPSHAPRNTFSFDSDSDSEDEFIEDVSNETGAGSGTPKSYTALSHVAGVNGIRSPSPESASTSNGNSSLTVNATGSKFGQAKGLANQLLGSWKGSD